MEDINTVVEYINTSLTLSWPGTKYIKERLTISVTVNISVATCHISGQPQDCNFDTLQEYKIVSLIKVNIYSHILA